jgi:hypothetical protein
MYRDVNNARSVAHAVLLLGACCLLPLLLQQVPSCCLLNARTAAFALALPLLLLLALRLRLVLLT